MSARPPHQYPADSIAHKTSAFRSDRRVKQLLAAGREAWEQRMIRDQDHDRPIVTKNAVGIDSIHAPHAEAVEQPATDDGAVDAQKNIHDEAFSGSVDDLARDVAGNEPENDPADD